MSIYWIDIEDKTGTRYGDGPIITAQGWRHTGYRNRIGNFSFSMPASDPRSQYLREFRIVRCWQMVDGVLVSRGAGRIRTIEESMGDGSTLTVSGTGLEGELAWATVGDLNLYDDNWYHPTRVFLVQDTVTTSMTYTIDYEVDDTTTYNSFNLIRGDLGKDTYLRVRCPFTFDAVHFILGTVTQYADLIELQYYDGETAAWETTSVTEDTTGDDGEMWSRTGTVTFNPPSTWDIEPGYANYELRFVNIGTNNTTTNTFYDISVRVKLETDAALSNVAASFPAGWALDAANGYTVTATRTPIGSELILTNTGFETFTGTEDDGTSDTFSGWTNVGVNDGAGDKIEATTAQVHSGSYAVKITATTTYNIYLVREIDVTEKKDITISYWTGAGGTGQAALKLYDASHGSDDLTSAVDSGVTGASWEQVSTLITTPEGCVKLGIILLGPLQLGTYCYIDDVSVKEGGGGTVMLEQHGESVWETLESIAEQTGENFTGGYSDRNILWLQKEERPTTLRAVIVDNPILANDNDDIVLIMSGKLRHDSSNLISRIYPFGGGDGDDRATLANCTRSVPTGYTLDKTNNYLERDDATTAYDAVISTQKTFSDVQALNSSTTQLERASNTLFDLAYEHLRKHSCTDLDRTSGTYDVPRFATVTVAKAKRPLWPGHTLHCVYDKWVDGYNAVHLDETMWINSRTVQLTANGEYTETLELATIDRAEQSDGDWVYGYIKDIKKGWSRSRMRVADGTYTSVIVSGGRIVGGYT